MGREPEITQLRTGQFVVEFFRHGAPARGFIGNTEDEALERLAAYLRTAQPIPQDTGEQTHELA